MTIDGTTAGRGRAGARGTGGAAGRRRRALAAVLAGALAVAVAGCSGGTAGGGAAQSATAGESSTEGVGGAPDGGGTGSGADATGAATAGDAPAPGVVDLALPGQDVVVRGSLTVVADDPLAAARAAAGATVRAGGYVERESSDLGDTGGQTERRSVQLVLRVPVPRFEAVRAEVAALGTEVSRSLTTDTVHEEVVDVRSRLATQRASVERVRALLDRASDLSEVVTIEAELTRRQADLEALEARDAALADQVGHATLVVDLLGTDAPLSAVAAPGFLGGLERGWSAFVATLTVALTVLGAALPFLVLVGLVVPVALAARRRRRGRTPS